jgi:uncharacterized protein (DUF58 family)
MPSGKRNPRQGGAIRFNPERHTGSTGLTITRGGAFYIAITLLLGFAAVNTGNNLLFLIVSALLGFMATSGIAGWNNIRDLSIEVELPDEIYAGLGTLAKVRIRNGKAHYPSFLLNSSILGNTVTTFLLTGGSAETDSFVHTFPERGTQAMTWAEIRSPFPVNFFVRKRRVAIDLSFPVFPAPLDTPGYSTLENAVKRAALPSLFKGESGELSRISDYTGNEPMKLIHWRLSAKYEEFKVKEMGSVSGEPVMIDVDSLPGRDLEERLSRACSLVNRLITAGRPVGLKLGEKAIAPSLSRRHRLSLLSELAVYGKD